MAASNANSRTKIDKTIAIETIDPFPLENSSTYDAATNLDESNYIGSARLNIDDEIANNPQETTKNALSAVGLDSIGSANDSPRSEINSLGDLCGYQIYSPGFRAIDPELKTFPKSNHFFSHNGKIVKGVAFNGCGNNPVLIGMNKKLRFLGGSQANPKIVRKKCFTKTGGSGKTREDLKLAIDSSIKFFKSKLN